MYSQGKFVPTHH